MIPKKLRGFITKLQKSTEDDDLTWHEGGEKAYFCDHKGHTLHISNHFDEDRGMSMFRFEVSTNGKSSPFAVSDEESDYMVMKDMYEATVVNANNVDESLEDFFD